MKENDRKKQQAQHILSFAMLGNAHLQQSLPIVQAKAEGKTISVKRQPEGLDAELLRSFGLPT